MWWYSGLTPATHSFRMAVELSMLWSLRILSTASGCPCLTSTSSYELTLTTDSNVRSTHKANNTAMFPVHSEWCLCLTSTSSCGLTHSDVRWTLKANNTAMFPVHSEWCLCLASTSSCGLTHSDVRWTLKANNTTMFPVHSEWCPCLTSTTYAPLFPIPWDSGSRRYISADNSQLKFKSD